MLLPELVELCDAVCEELLPGRRLAVQPAEMAHPGEERRMLVRVRDVREHALEQLGRLAERDRALRLVGRAQAGVDGLLGAAGAQQMPGDGQCASVAAHERVGGA